MKKYSQLNPQCGLWQTVNHTNETAKVKQKEVFKITELQSLGPDWWTFGAIESVQDDSEPLNQATTIFRNLQDYISGVDRNSYAWEKMGQAQMRGMMSQYNPQNERQSTAANEESQ